MAQAKYRRYTSIDRVLDILLMFGASSEPLSMPMLARAFGTSRSSTYRYLQILRSRGLVEEAATAGHYRLGPAATALACNMPPERGSVDQDGSASRPVGHGLSARTPAPPDRLAGE